MSNIPENPSNDNPGNSGKAPAQSAPFLGVNVEGRVLSLKDSKELTAQRGFKLETLKALKFFSAAEADLPALGISVPFGKLPSAIALPYLAETANGLTLVRVHKTSAENFQYPPYLTPAQKGSTDIVITESEIKAAMVFQLGDQGVGLQGTNSFLSRVAILGNAVRSSVSHGAQLFVLPDHERLLQDGKQVVYGPTIQMLRLAYALSLDLGCTVKMITLPDGFLEPACTHSGEPKVKADLDGCVAKGLTQEDWQRLKTDAKVPWELEISVQCIVEGMAAADADEFLDTTLLKQRLSILSVDESCGVCEALAKVLARKCYASEGNFDKAKFEVYKKEAVEWAKKNGLMKVTTKNFQVVDAGEEDTTAEKLIAHCMRESERGVVLIKRGEDSEIVAPFLLQGCAYGNVFYPGADKLRRFRVSLKTCLGGKPQTQIITLDKDIFAAEQYTLALSDIVVADPKRFKMYAAEKLQIEGFQRHDPELDSPLFVGLVSDGGRVFALPNTRFPRRDQDCYYHGAKLSESGDANAAFQEIAAISPPMDVALAHLLGAPLKALLGAYPHGSWIGDASAAKTTIAAETCTRTGFGKVAAQEQLTSRYRQLRVMGNHNVPIFIEEAHRLPEEHAGAALSVLNTAYNGAYCSHGPDGHYYIAGCAILLGQDRSFDDEAFETKQVVIHFEPEKLNADALTSAKTKRSSFPVAKWLEFLSNAGARVQSLHNEKVESLRTALASAGINCKGAERTLFNYACVMVSTHFLRDFGVAVEIDAKVANFCRLHIAGKLHTGDEHPAATSCAERFIRDVLEAVTTTRDIQNLSGTIDVEFGKGVWIRLTPVFDYLKKRNPDRYDVRDAARMGECIRRRFAGMGVTSGNKHRFGNTRKDALFLPVALCAEMGIELLKSDGSDEIV